MKRILSIILLTLSFIVSNVAAAAEKKLPAGDVANDSVELKAVVLDAEHLQQTFGTDFGGAFVVVEVTLTPKSGKPLDVHLDDFLMRSEQTGEHTGALAASQIAGSSSLVVQQTAEGRSKTSGYGGFGGVGVGSSPGMPAAVSNKVEAKNSDKKDPLLDVLKRKILADKTTTQPVTGLLFFPMEKEKVKHLEMTYSAKQDRLKVRFK